MTSQKKKKIGAGIAGALAVLAAGTALANSGTIKREGVQVASYSAQAEPGYCTVLVYMDGSDLESDYGMAAGDLQEMEEAVARIDADGSQVHVVVEAGGSAEWQYEPMQDREYGRFCITGEGVSEIEEMEARDMGRPDTLTDFINYGTQSYPAEHYGLICWNHGSGQITGFGSDSNFEESALSIDELRDALNESEMKKKFDFIGMDACLMGNLELVAALEPKASYLIASEELEPQYGYNYSWMEVLKPDALDGAPFGEGVGKSILDTYDAYYKDSDYKLTLSLINLGAYEQFHSVFHELLAQMSGLLTENEYQKIGQKRSDLLGFGRQSETAVAEQVDMMDVFTLLAGFEAESVSGAGESAVQALQKAYTKLVVASISRGYAHAPSGLSMYLPSGDNNWLADDMETYRTAGFCEKYHDLVDEYGKYLMKENDMEWRKPSEKQGKIVLPLEPETIDDIADAYLAMFYENEDGVTYLLSADGDVTLDRAGFLKAKPEMTLWGLQGQPLSLMENYDTEFETEYTAPVLFKKAGGDWEHCHMAIAFSDDNPDGQIRSITPVEVSKQEYEIADGDEMIPLYPIRQTEETNDSDDNGYYRGKAIAIQSTEAGDARLEQVSIEDESRVSYGFMIRDTKMNLHYTDAAGDQPKQQK